MRLAVLTLVLASLSLGLQAAPKRPKKSSSRPAAPSNAGSVHVMQKGETAAQVARAKGHRNWNLVPQLPRRSSQRLHQYLG